MHILRCRKHVSSEEPIQDTTLTDSRPLCDCSTSDCMLLFSVVFFHCFGHSPPDEVETCATLHSVFRVLLHFAVYFPLHLRRTNRGHTGGGKYLELCFFSLVLYQPKQLPAAVLALNFYPEGAVRPSLSFPRQRAKLRQSSVLTSFSAMVCYRFHRQSRKINIFAWN